MRLGCGGFVSGFRSGLPEDDGKYAVAQVAGARADLKGAGYRFGYKGPDIGLSEYDGKYAGLTG